MPAKKPNLSFHNILLVFSRGSFGISALVAALYALAYQLLCIHFRYSLDYGEAPLVDQALRLSQGMNIYLTDLSHAPYTISNYPPLYVVLLALGVKLFGVANGFVVGRSISALASWIAAACVYTIIHNFSKNRLASLVGAGVFIAFPFVTFWSPFARIDMLALALSLGALAILTKVPLSWPRLITAALLLLAAIFTRQSYALAAPMAAFVWLLSQDRRKAIGLALLVGFPALALFLLLNNLTAGGFAFNIITANINAYDLPNLTQNLINFFHSSLIPILFGLLSFALTWGVNKMGFLSTSYLVGAFLSALTVGKAGSNVNYLLELCAALALCTGGVIAWANQPRNASPNEAGMGAPTAVPSLLGSALVLVLTAGLIHSLYITSTRYAYSLETGLDNTAGLIELEAYVKDTPGLILADEYMGMLTLQGRPLVIQPFEVTQLAYAGMWDQTPLLTSIAEQEFDAIILYDQWWSLTRWTPEMLAAIQQHYSYTKYLAGNKIYTPNRPLIVSYDPVSCPGSTWTLPGDATRGVKWANGSLVFFGQGPEGEIPLYSPATGLLSRPVTPFGTLAILLDDPLNPAEKLWAVFEGLGNTSGDIAFTAPGFDPGSQGIPVQAGQRIGFQGNWSGKPNWPTWTHVTLSLLPALDGEAYPSLLTAATSTSLIDPAVKLDPAARFGLELESELDNQNQQKLRCLSQ